MMLMLALLLGLTLSACAPGGDNTQAGGNPLANQPDKISQEPVSDNPEETLKYWTADKMRSAVNLDVLKLSDAQFSQLANLAKKAADSVNLGEKPSTLPDIPSTMSPGDLQDLLKQLAPYTSNTSSTQSAASALGAFTSQVPNVTYKYPLSTVGKVFFTIGGRNAVCSGVALNSENKSLVDTAGHCLHSKQYGWASKWIFCPMYYNGTTPYGCWAAKSYVTTSEWANNEDAAFDFGLVVMHPRSAGKLVTKVGGVGWAHDVDTTKYHYNAYGYPAKSPFNGQTLKSCENRTATIWKDGDENVISIPCNMNNGSSGGPWLINYNGGWYLNGHNDFISSRYPNTMFSPYYGEAWFNLYQRVRNADAGSVVNI
jgi:V8-like Glu-specific endopeptidase